MIREQSFGPVRRYDLARTILGRGRYWTAAYWVDGLLIDSGPARTAAELARTVQDLPLQRIATTHSHEDHIGAHGLLQSQRRVPIAAHPAALPTLADPARLRLQWYRRFFWGWPAPCRAEPLAPGGTLSTARYRFQVLYTPGHSPDHICLFEPRLGWLFSGDLYVGGEDQVLGPERDIWAIIQSLKRIAALPLTVLFPGSARIRQDPLPAIQRKIAYLEELGERVLDLHRRGWSAGRIARHLLGGPNAVELITAGNFSRRHLVLSYLRNGQAR